MYDADDFTVHQLGYARHADPAKDRNRRKRRLFELRQLLREFERRDLIRPYKPWGGYFSHQMSGALRGKLAVRWSRGPAVRAKSKSAAAMTFGVQNDALYDQLRVFKGDKG